MFLACAAAAEGYDAMMETMLPLVVLADTGDHVEVHAPFSQVLVKGKEATFAIVLMSADSQLKNKDIEGLYDNLYPHPTPQKVTA